MGNDSTIVRKVTFIIQDHIIQSQLFPVRPDLRDVSALGNVSMARHINSLTRLVNFHIATVRYVERSVIGNLKFVISLLG